jgi:hypothetical protein
MMANLWPSTLVGTGPRPEQIDIWEARSGQGDHHLRSVARHGPAAPSARGATP